MSDEPEDLRVYTSFAAFERAELARLGLTAWPARAPVEPPPIPAPAPAPEQLPMPSALVIVPVVPAKARGRTVVTAESLRAEGIVEIGCAKGTSVLYVRTHLKLHVLHATWLPDRRLDDYAVSLAVAWIENQGMPSYEVAKNLGVSENTLRAALTAAGYERLTPEQHANLARARTARKIGNRRGRLVRSGPTTNEAPREGARA